MTCSDKARFVVNIMGPDEKYNYKIIESVDKKNYICACKDQSFIIEMVQRNTPENVYGTKLFIDGREVNGLKTFKYRAHYFGFKMGNGVYKQFVFDIPPLREDSKSSDEIRHENREFGTIKIQFFKTEKVLSRRREKKFSRYVPHIQSVREDNKKFYERTLSVKEGEVFKIDTKNFYGNFDNYNGEYMKDYIIDYSSMVDEVTFYYTDFIALQIKGIVRYFIL
jgi:hypothetical protein